MLLKNATISQFLVENKVQVLAITEENAQLLNTHFTIDDYLLKNTNE